MADKPVEQVNTNIPVSEWKWFGCAGHLCVAQYCRFHLCTKVGAFLISTVGEYVHPRHGNGSEQSLEQWVFENWPGEDVGLDRKYETMVFKAGKPCKDANCGCDQPEIDPEELDMEGYNNRGAATRGHLVLCEKYAQQGSEDKKGETDGD